MNPPSTLHFVGISGIGMSALARILLKRGYRVTGSSDRRTPLTDALEREGARVSVGHAAENVGEAQRVIVSSAVSEENPELREAHRRGLPIVKRGALLAELLNERQGIAIAGTHGKSTTTTMVTTVLEAGGLAPAYAIGAERIDTGVNAADAGGAWFVAESDESDRSFTVLRPRIAVLGNIENDHVANDHELDELVGLFDAFLGALPADGLAFIGIDEPHAAALAAHPRAARTITYGLRGGDLVACDLRAEGFGTSFRVEREGKTLGNVRLRVPGTINVLNALPAIGIAMELGIPFAVAAEALAAFPGIRRRFEILARTPRLTVIDDYAHHPTAVGATIAAARAGFDGPITAVFQPHRYTRTQYLAAGFTEALRAADRVVLTDVYAASESPIPGVDARLIGEPLRAEGREVRYVPVERVPEDVAEHAPIGSLVLMLGAGSITGAAARLASMVADVSVAARG